MVRRWNRKKAKRLLRPVRWLSGRGVGWGWWISHDEENYQGPYDTRDEAIRAGIWERLGEGFKGLDSCGRFYILEAKQGPLRLSQWIDADDLLMGMTEAVDDDLGGENGIDWDCWTSEHEKQLQRWLRPIVDLWQWWNGVEVRTWGFTHSRNAECYTYHDGI